MRVGRLVAAFTAVFAMATLVPAGSAQAAISGTSGQILQIVPPASAATGLGSNVNMWAWDEQQGVTLASSLKVDITSPGIYSSAGQLLTGVAIPPGTVVDSQYISSVAATGTGASDLTGTLTFPADILGVIVTSGKLATSDVLGAPATNYPGTGAGFALEFDSGGDSVGLANQRTISFHSHRASGTGVDELRVLTEHDGAPTVSAGGPYSGLEGSAVALHGTASDAENDPLTITWTFAVTSAKPGTVCTPANTTTLNPTLTCNDDAVLTASLSVKDPYNPATISTGQVTVGNVAPALGPLTAPAVVPQSGAVSVSASFSDAGTHDTHTTTVNWGDTTSSNATTTEAAGAGSIAASHTYASPGQYTVVVTIVDDDSGVATRSVTIGVNAAPSANAGGPYAGTEGSTANLIGTASDPENDPLTTNWTFAPTLQDPGTTCTPTGTSTLTPTITCNDDAVLQATLSANDNINPPVSSDAVVAIGNVAPVLGALTAAPAMLPTGGTVNVNASFIDAGTHDTHTAGVSWGDTSTSNASITEAGGAGSLTGAHAYTQAGFYTITVTLHDDNGGTDVRTAQVVVNTPPTVDAGGPYVGLEGTQMQLAATAIDVDGDPLSYSWAFTTTGGAGAACNATGAGTHAATLTLVCNDNAVVNATVTVSDGVNASVSDSATLTVGNQNPVPGAVTQQPTAPLGTTVAIAVPFTDPGTNDTHTATIDWGDSTTTVGTVSESAGAGTVTGSHNYAGDNHYTVTVTITDKDGDVGTVSGTVLSDTTPPVITGTVAPAPNGAGWNNSPVNISWTAVDPLAPITATSGCDPITRSVDTSASGVTYTCTATSAGGTASKSVSVKLDQVAPSLSGAATTPPNANGWYNSPVTVHWTCSDALSGIAGSCPSNALLSSEGSAVSTSATISDVADNVTNAASSSVKIDTHAPTTSAGTLPAWNNETVTLALNPTDNLSGVASTHYAVDGGATQTGTSVLLTTEGIHTVIYWSVDNADNVEQPNTATVKIDTSAPSISVSQAPDANAAGWNNTNVTVTFTCGDSISGLASCTLPQSVTAEGAGQVISGTAVDNAGNSASAAATLNVDKTPPTINGVIPAANGNGWYNSPVSVSWQCSDALSGVATCSPSSTLATDGAGQSVTGSATDVAGNATDAHVNGINIDQAPPSITASLAPAANLAGWNNSAVVVHFTCTDATSGIASGGCPADQTVSTQGISTVSGSVVDRAGNAAAASVVVKVDTIAPAIVGSQTPAPNGAGWNNTNVAVSFNCTDSGSGIATAGCTAPVSLGEGANQSVTGTAADVAGNMSTTTVSGINVDETPPTLTGAPTTAPNANGWYAAPVTIHWSCGDALSGVAGSCPSDTVLGSEGSAVSATATVHDVAGNLTTASSAPVKIDLTAPSTAASSAANWSNTNVTLTLSATDSLSGVDATHFIVDGGASQSGTSVLLTTEGVHTVVFWSVDKAGNVEASHTASVKIDTTAPSITVSQAPVANGAGWNNTDVTVSFACGDSLSGLASCTLPQSVTAEGAGQVVSGTATDNAGNSASASTTVNVDKTAPTISGVVPAANLNGWYSAPVTVSWSCADALSGVAACSPATTLSADGAAQSVSGTATDAAGNSNATAVNGINIDQIPPTLTASAPPNALGWYSAGPITVHWTCSDNLSGVTSCPADQVVTAEGFTTLAQTITDQAGNTTTDSITIRIDATPPSIVGTATPAPNGNGWNNTNVNVSFTCHDGLSGVVTCSAPTTLAEGAAQSVTGFATDAAANAASATVSGINVDKTAPTLSGAPTSAPNGNGWYNHAVTIHWTCGDALSGVDPATCPADASINAEGVAQQLTRTVLDLAGNAASASSPAVKVDLTPPVTTASAVPSSFTNADVAVTLTAGDNLSGVAQTRFSVDGGPNQVGTTITLSSDGTHTLSFWSVDNAGNVESAHVVTVRIDTASPTITASQAPPANGAGWNVGNVTVTFTCGDSLSGIASCTSPQSVTSEGAGQTVSGTAVDNAGNTALTSASVSIDKTPPTIVGSLNGTPNGFGWFNVPVAASFACSDVLSGIASCSGGASFGQGASQSATGVATDVAGNTTTVSVGPVNVDLTKPTITATPDRAPDSGGVYTGPVTIHFTCTDALSGIAPGACPADVVVSSDGVTTVSGSTADRAGNTAATAATITVTVQSVRLQKQTALIQISNALAASTSHLESVHLRLAANALAASIDPSLWGVGNHIQEHRGVVVFEREKVATIELKLVLAVSPRLTSTSTINGWIATFTNVDRVLATTQLNDAIAAGGGAAAIQNAQALIAAGDTAAGTGDNVSAIQNYKNAWKWAELAIGHQPDGGNDPDDH